MPVGELYIFNWDGVNGDCFTLYGVSLEDGAIGELLTPPPAKERVSNESRLEPGKRVNTRTPMQFASREVTLPMHLIAPDYATFLSRYRAFMTAITQSAEGIILYYCPYTRSSPQNTNSLKFRLQYLSCTQFAAYDGTLAKFAVRFIERYPSLGVGTAPALTMGTGGTDEEEEEGSES